MSPRCLGPPCLAPRPLTPRWALGTSPEDHIVQRETVGKNSKKKRASGKSIVFWGSTGVFPSSPIIIVYGCCVFFFLWLMISATYLNRASDHINPLKLCFKIYQLAKSKCPLFLTFLDLSACEMDDPCLLPETSSLAFHTKHDSSFPRDSSKSPPPPSIISV